MQFDYNEIVDFFTNEDNGYFKSYSTIAQDPKTINEMNRYYSPDIKIATYFPMLIVVDREQFLRISSSHPGIQETLLPEHIAVDEKQGLVGVLLNAKFAIKDTGEIIEQMFTAHYKLTRDENDELKIINLWIFAEYVPPGKQNIVDLYEDAFKAAL
ncbi:MAG: hypothetical protein P8X68_19775 [Desulfobacterales bacterium]|jgi:hypothetical protein